MIEPSRLTKKMVSLALKLGATDAAAYISLGVTRMIRFSNNEITVVKEMEEREAELFVAIKDKRASVSTSNLSVRNIDNLVREAVKIAEKNKPSGIYAPLPEGPFKYDKSLLRAGKISGEPEKLVEYVETAVNSALSQGVKRVAGSLIHSRGKYWIRTSGRAYGVAEDSGIEISIRAFASDDATGHWVSVAADERDFKPEEAGEKAGEIARLALNPVPGEPGVYETLLGPLTFGHLIEQVGYASSAFHVDAGLSFLAEKLGQRIASENFTLMDDPTIPGMYGSEPFDDEGLPTKKTIIVEDGILNSYLHNSTTAKKFGVESTANAGLIVPEPFNLIVEGDGKPLEKLISEIDDGLYVTNDWYLLYQNYRTGDFSTIPRDGIFRIRRGSIETPVKELRISDNFLKILQNIRGLSRERYYVKWWEIETPVLAPYAVISKLNFTKSVF